MIRIDEIYNHTFWPWLEKNRSGTRLFFCDPPGHTNPEHLFNLGRDDIIETDFVFFHDQEPVDYELYKKLFDEVSQRNYDLWWPAGSPRPPKPSSVGHIVVSERGEFVEKICEMFEWKSHYYFYHGWACLDWFRGYDRTFLIPRARDRNPTQTFMSPNRIIGGKRDHRVLFLYNIFKHGLGHNNISAPKICPVENVSIQSIAQKFSNVYQDINLIFDHAELPCTFVGENTQQMTSCWLGNFSEAQDSLIYVPTETVYFGKRLHLTEKTFKAIALEMPFVLIAPVGSLEYLREYGFKTFAGILDESYDEETDDIRRVEKVVKLLKDLEDLSVAERQQIHRACLPLVEHNYKHFYQGGFAEVLWHELLSMLDDLRV